MQRGGLSAAQASKGKIMIMKQKIILSSSSATHIRHQDLGRTGAGII